MGCRSEDSVNHITDLTKGVQLTCVMALGYRRHKNFFSLDDSLVHLLGGACEIYSP